MTFDELGLDPRILRAVREQGYDAPTPIQAQAIPLILQSRDLMAAAQTGTGKTAGFTLPMLERIVRSPRSGRRAIRALVLAPTRELAAQVAASVATYGRHLPLKSLAVFGGVGIRPQIRKLEQGVDLLIATPGRLLDLVGQGAANLSQVEILVLDEADRMLDMGFVHDIRRIQKRLPDDRQTLLFSATFSTSVRRLAASMQRDPARIEIARNEAGTSIEQGVYPVEQHGKRALLAHLIQAEDWRQVLVFTRTKHGANRLAGQLERDGIKATAIHGNKSQSARTKALDSFKRGKVRVLVATDVAARGLDIDALPHVVNFDLPNVAEDYVHRIGRTGRAGRKGRAVSLVSNEERGLLRGIERLIGERIARERTPEGFQMPARPEGHAPCAPGTGRIRRPAPGRGDARRARGVKGQAGGRQAGGR
ncbi:MAG: DEAD/DEAH box helicase [Mariprofundaceae bacterium]